MVVEIVRREFEIEFFLELHHDVDDHRRVQSKTIEFCGGLDATFWNSEHIRQRVDAKVRDLLSCHVSSQLRGSATVDMPSPTPTNFKGR